MDQLPDDLRIRFPVVLTRKFACDKAVVSLMHARTAGNSPTALCGDIHQLHSEEWMQRTVTYLSDCPRHKKMLAGMKCVSLTYNNPPSFKMPPTYKWFLAVYVRDVWSRLPTLKASLTSVYGSILKIDSTKKITRKLQGKAASSASWCTNVGNERREVLLSLLTTSESLSNLEKMAEGLMNRYTNANQADPVVLYTDRDCCKSRGEQSKYQVLFHRWEKLRVRLDCWHFMIRLSTVCSNESHPLYGTFMKKISAAIFEWEPTDVEALRKAKRNELLLTGIINPSPETVNRAVKKTELARHCRRRTRGKEKTIQSIESVLLSLRNSTDCLGVPLFRDGEMDVWNVEKIHMECIQDPEDVQLYTKVGDLLKGGVSLPVFRCGRGTTSLESCHCHLKNFIPGKSIQKNVVNWWRLINSRTVFLLWVFVSTGTAANDIHFQAFLLDGIDRWNFSRASAAIDAPASRLRSFDSKLRNKIHRLTSDVLGKPLDSNYRTPAVHTGELFGVEYLYTEEGMNIN